MIRTEINGVIYVGVLNKCNECGSLYSLLNHHIQYEPVEIIKVLCRSCHVKFHKRHPDDLHVPDNFEHVKSKSHKNKWTSISLSRNTKTKIEEFSPEIGIGMSSSWDDLLLALLNEAKEYQKMKGKYFNK